MITQPTRNLEHLILALSALPGHERIRRDPHHRDLIYTLNALHRLLPDDRLPPTEREAIADCITVLLEYHYSLLTRREELPR